MCPPSNHYRLIHKSMILVGKIHQVYFRYRQWEEGCREAALKACLFKERFEAEDGVRGGVKSTLCMRYHLFCNVIGFLLNEKLQSLHMNLQLLKTKQNGDSITCPVSHHSPASIYLFVMLSPLQNCPCYFIPSLFCFLNLLRWATTTRTNRSPGCNLCTCSGVWGVEGVL